MGKILRDYFNLARSDHLRFDLGVPIIISILLIVVSYLKGVGVLSLLKGINDSIGTIITAFSILAGFNTASLSIFATSDSLIARKLRIQQIEGTDRSKMEQILAYFTWSIVVQLTLLFISIISSLLIAHILPINLILQVKVFVFITWVLLMLGVAAILYSVLLTVRNVVILNDYLIAGSRNPNCLQDPNNYSSKEVWGSVNPRTLRRYLGRNRNG